MPPSYYATFLSERRTGTSRMASYCAFTAMLLLILAAFLPMWVVTSFTGHAKILAVTMDVDLVVGDGLFKRNVCYGSSRPDDEFLEHFGLSCAGSLQTLGCEDQSGMTNSQKDHCDYFVMIQAFQTSAMFFAFAGLVFGAMAAHIRFTLFKTFLRLGALACVCFSFISACVTTGLVEQSDMITSIPLQCGTVLGGSAQLCRRYGAAMILQIFGEVALGIAAFSNLLLLCCVSDDEYVETRVPLLGENYGGGLVYQTAPTYVIGTSGRVTNPGHVYSTAPASQGQQQQQQARVASAV